MMFFCRRPKRIERLKKEITEQKQAIEELQTYQQQVRRLIGRLVLAEEQERRRIAVFLTNGFGQELASLKMSLDALRQSARSAELASSFEEILKSILKMIQDIRSLAFDLSPAILYELGLEPAVEWLVEKTQAEQDIAAIFEDDGQDKSLEDEVRVSLFRAVRELLANVTKHAGAQNLRVYIRKDGPNIRVEVEDDGVGFDVAEVQARRDPKVGFGLLLLRELLAAFGGILQVNSQPGRGTRVTLRAPLRSEQGRS